MLLADIGNTHFHLYNGLSVEHLSYAEAMEKYGDEALHYISVQHEKKDDFKQFSKWVDMASCVTLQGAYEGMGIDRQALCKSVSNGVLVDAGSAITIDFMRDGVWQGGSILLGLRASLGAYANISKALDTTLNTELYIELSMEKLPRSTRDAISYGIIAPIKALIDSISGDLPLYFTGGDGAFLATFFQDATYDETLVFQGMQQALKEHKRC